jgi:hypothetical protein
MLSTGATLAIPRTAVVALIDDAMLLASLTPSEFELVLQSMRNHLQCCVPSPCQWHVCLGCALAAVIANSATMAMTMVFISILLSFCGRPSRASHKHRRIRGQ